MSHRERRPSRKCAFCGAGKLSKEHVWSDWAKDILPRSAGSQQFFYQQWPGDAPQLRQTTDRQGNITGTKLRVVCERCNNGWMSVVESQAREVVSAVMTGRPMMLTRQPRELLRQWLTLKLIVLDASRPDHQVFLEDERRAFMEKRLSPATLKLWLVACGEPPWNSAYRAQTQSIGDNPRDPMTPMPNVKMLTWGIGDAVVIAHYQRVVNMKIDFNNGYFAKQLLPDRGIALSWPPEGRITAKQAEESARALDKLYDDPNMRFRRFDEPLVETQP